MISVNPHIYIFSEGTIKTGFGHTARDLILAQKFRSLNYVITFIVNKQFVFNKRIEKEGFNIRVIDKFDNKLEVLNVLNSTGDVNSKICLIDLVEEEYKKLYFLSNFQNLYIVTITLFLFNIENRYEDLSFFPAFIPKQKEVYYSIFDKKVILYKGKDYFIFRNEFSNLNKVIKENAKSVLITMGGTDPYGFTFKVLDSISDDGNLNITVILDKRSPTFEQVSEICKKQKIKLIQHTDSISKLMINHDIIVLNGGSTRYEACLCRTPFLAISIHQTQFEITEKISSKVGSINLGVGDCLDKIKIKKAIHMLLNDFEQRFNISKKMRNYLDTNGATTVATIIIKEYKNQFYNERNDRVR